MLYVDRKNKEEEFMLLSERQRRRDDDPLYSFVPHGKQRAFLNNVLER